MKRKFIGILMAMLVVTSMAAVCYEDGADSMVSVCYEDGVDVNGTISIGADDVPL